MIEREQEEKKATAPGPDVSPAPDVEDRTKFSNHGAIPPVAMETGEHGQTASERAYATKPDPLMMPADIVAFEKKNHWGQHHLEWHIERQWDSFVKDPSNAAWAKKQGWQRAALQEGDKGNGIQFLAMHRNMLQTLREKFPQEAALFDGWDSPPLTSDADNPGPSEPMSPEALKAIDTLEHLDQHIDAFADDDDFGRFVQTGIGNKHSPDLGMAGVHNYLHNRFSDDKSKITMGDPTVNIENKMFWRLHGWIDKKWDEFRALKKEKPDQPEYVKAMQEESMSHMGPMPMHGTQGNMTAMAPSSEAAPASVRGFMMNGGSWGKSDGH